MKNEMSVNCYCYIKLILKTNTFDEVRRVS